MLVAAMPPLVRAELSSSEEGHAPEAVVGDLLGAVMDACARSFLADGFSEPRGRRRPNGSPTVVEAWLAALTDTDPVINADQLRLAALAGPARRARRRDRFQLMACRDPASGQG